jgi:hypothetical protein
MSEYLALCSAGAYLPANVIKLRTDEHGMVPLLSKEGTQENDAKHVLLRGWLAASIALQFIPDRNILT